MPRRRRQRHDQAFGCVAFVALTPIVSIQICGLIYKLKSKSAIKRLSTEQEFFLDYSAPTNQNGKEVSN